MPDPAIGRIVRYTLTRGDAGEVNRRRAVKPWEKPGWPAGAQAHVGHAVAENQELPAMVIEVLTPTSVSLRVFLPGNDVLWVPIADLGEWPGHWNWPVLEA